MNTSAPCRLTISTTLTSSGWSAPAWNTASCPATVCGTRRMPLLELFPLARRIRWAQTSFPPTAQIFSSPAKKPASSGNLSGAFAHLNLDYDDCFVGAFCLVRIAWEKGTAYKGDDHASKCDGGLFWWRYASAASRAILLLPA